MCIMSSDEILDAQEVAGMLKVNVRTLTRWAEDPNSDLEGFKLGDLWRFYRSDVDNFIQKSKLRSKKPKKKKEQ